MKCQSRYESGILLLSLLFFGCSEQTSIEDALSPDILTSSDAYKSGGEYSSAMQDTGGEVSSTGVLSSAGDEDGCGGEVSLVLEISFSEYIMGQCILLLVQEETGEIFFQEHVEGSRRKEETIALQACRGQIRLFVFNDFDGNLLFEPSFEGYAQKSVFVSTEDIRESITLQLPLLATEREYPRIATTYLNPSLSEENEALLQEFSLSSLLILDHSILEHSPGVFSYIRAESPEILLLVYTAPMSITRLRSDLEQEKYDLTQAGDLYMAGMWHGDYVEELQHWPGNSMVNFTQDVLAHDAHFFEKWAEMHVRYLVENDVLGDIDGLFFDECWDDISWIPRNAVNGITGFDTNYDGDMESLTPDEDGYCSMDLSYQAGWTRFLQWMQEFSLEHGRDWIFMGNEGNLMYYQYINKYFEDAPNTFLGGLEGTMGIFSEALLHTPQGIAVWNVAGRPGELYTDLIQRCRVGAFIANILGGYYGCDDTAAHDHPFHIDEDLYLLGMRVQGHRALANGVWLAVFEHGINLYNTTGQAQEIRFGTELLSISGTQRPDLNTGMPVRAITLPPSDGILLLYQK